MKNLKNLLCCVSLLTLIGCATSKESFDCKVGKGVGCHSITEVNGMVNQGKLGKESPRDASELENHSLPVESHNIKGADPMRVQRVTEEHLRLWIAPFQDKQGNFHEGAIVHTVLKPGSWQVEGI